MNDAVRTCQLVPASEGQREELASWLQTAAQAMDWGGPWLRFPFDAQTFREDSRWDALPNRALVGPTGNMLGFGQYYLRAGRCHLGHLIIAPGRRGRGLGGELVRRLAEEGCRELQVSECSLFVLADNVPAVQLYRRLGFSSAVYPQPMEDLDKCEYLVASLASVQAGPEALPL